LWLIGLAVALLVALHVSFVIDEIVRGGWGLWWYDALRLAAGASCLVLSVVLLIRVRAKRPALGLALFLLFLSLMYMGGGYVSYPGSGRTLRLHVVHILEGTLGLSGSFSDLFIFLPGTWAYWFTLAAFIYFSRAFPAPREAVKTWRDSPWLLFGAALILSVAYHTIDAWYDDHMEQRLVGGSLTFALAATYLLGVWIGLRDLISNYRAAGGAARRSAQWVFLGLLLGGFMVVAYIILNVLVDLPYDAVMISYSLVLLFIVLGVGMGIFYSGTFDPTLAIRKSTVYGLTGVTLAILFGVFEEATSTFIVGRFQLPDSLGTWIGSIISVLAIAPILRTVERRVPRASSEEAPAAAPACREGEDRVVTS
jgi:hypothetical protein